jgi:hypothetical protein
MTILVDREWSSGIPKRDTRVTLAIGLRKISIRPGWSYPSRSRYNRRIHTKAKFNINLDSKSPSEYLLLVEVTTKAAAVLPGRLLID